jgi:hypothetical protein
MDVLPVKYLVTKEKGHGYIVINCYNKAFLDVQFSYLRICFRIPLLLSISITFYITERTIKGIEDAHLIKKE